MKITGMKTYHVKPRWLFLKLMTAEGICGWGEPVVRGKSRTTETAVRELFTLIEGKNPLPIETLWQKIYRGSLYRGGPMRDRVRIHTHIKTVGYTMGLPCGVNGTELPGTCVAGIYSPEIFYHSTVKSIETLNEDVLDDLSYDGN
ncbi:MAG: hypothetical protein SCM11_04605 [Bacillota bacterium]|nr:hypothetical protein [Bacillota bacterium]